MSLTEGSPLPNITTNQAQQTTAPSWYTDYLSNLANFVTGQTIGTPGASGAPGTPGSAKFVGAQPLQSAAFQLAGNIAKSYGIDPAMFLKTGTGASTDAGTATTAQPIATGTSTDGGIQPMGVQGALGNLQNLASSDITKAATPGGQKIGRAHV